jgi:hypothetical protein
MADPPPPTDESLNCTFNGTQPESGGLAVKLVKGFRNTLINIESINGLPAKLPVQITIKLPELKKVWVGLAKLDEVRSPKSQLIAVRPGGEVKLTFTSGTHPLVALAVICALADITMNNSNISVKRELLNKQEKLMNVMFFVFKMMALKSD